MAVIVVLLLMIGSALFQYLKGSIAKATVMLVAVTSCGFAALGFYEPLAGLVGRYTGALADWADLLCFVVIFVMVLAILQTAITQFLKDPIDLGKPYEQFARPIIGALIGYILSGILLIAAELSPLPVGLPYPRFEALNPDPTRPRSVLLGPDSLVSGWFGLLSRGSMKAMSNPRSFAVIRAGFLDQLYLNRIGIKDKVTRRTDGSVMEVARPCVWKAPLDVSDLQQNRIPLRPGHALMLARIGFKRTALSQISPFTLSQLRVVCKPAGQTSDPLSGRGLAVYPIGYMAGQKQMALKRLSELIKLEDRDFDRDQTVRWIDFGFYIPEGWVPVLAQFKLNNTAKVSLAKEEGLQVVPFGNHSQ